MFHFTWIMWKLNTLRFSRSNPNWIDSRQVFEINKWFACVHEGCAKHPCTRSTYSLGFAVRPIRPYPLGQGRTKGANGEVNFSTQVPKVTKNNRMMSRLEQG